MSRLPCFAGKWLAGLIRTLERIILCRTHQRWAWRKGNTERQCKLSRISEDGVECMNTNLAKKRHSKICDRPVSGE